MRIKKNIFFITQVFVILLLCLMLQGCEAAKNQDPKVDETVNETQEKRIVVADESNTESDTGNVESDDDVDNTMLNVETEDAISYSSIPAEEAPQEEEIEEIKSEEDKVLRTEDGRVIVDLIMFMGQSNMSGTGGNAQYAPRVPGGYGYEFRAISDPTRLYPIEEPFGINENVPGAIEDLPIAKRGSMVSAFVNRYYELTGVPVVAVSASSGGRDTGFWMRDEVEDDFAERQRRAQVWLES
nr:hypothetical protein [Lachnospiraceae bacterium]